MRRIVLIALVCAVAGALFVSPVAYAGCCGRGAYGAPSEAYWPGIGLRGGSAGPAASCCPPVAGQPGSALRAAPNVQRPSSGLPPCCQGANAPAPVAADRASGPTRDPQGPATFARPIMAPAAFGQPAQSGSGGTQPLPPCCQQLPGPKAAAAQPAVWAQPESPLLSAILAGPSSR